MVEEQNGSAQSIKDHVWGLAYIDEAVQTRINTNPTGTASWNAYWLMQDANYNVLGVVDSSGVLAERYEYTPYGERHVFASAGSNDPGCYAPQPISTRVVTSGSVTQPYGLCEIGHQGLMHDEEAGVVYGRGRVLNPPVGRWNQADPLGYVDGSNLYQLDEDDPIGHLDPNGLAHMSMTKTTMLATPVGIGWSGIRWEGHVVSKTFINGVPLGTAGFLLPGRNDLLQAGALFTDQNFRENPANDSMDHAYRLYGSLSLFFTCTCMGKISYKDQPPGYPIFRDDPLGGVEPGGHRGTTKLDKDTLTRVNDSTLRFHYRVSGHPDPRVEWSFQVIRPRTSIRIWNEVAGTFSCKGPFGLISLSYMRGSEFPSHRAWLMGRVPYVYNLSQGNFSNLWTPDPVDPSLAW